MDRNKMGWMDGVIFDGHFALSVLWFIRRSKRRKSARRGGGGKGGGRGGGGGG